jgi:hypothetical protein
VNAQSAKGLLAFAIGDLEALYTPQTLHSLLVHAVPLSTTVVIGPSTPTRMLLGEGDEPEPQLLFVVAGQGDLETLGGAVLADHATGAAFFHPERFLEHENCSTARVRG